MLHEINGYSIEYTNEKEFKHLIREIFKKQIYSIDLNNNPLIIDAGAHIGLATIFFKMRYPKAKVISIEANPNLYRVLTSNLERNSMENVEALSTALSKRQGIRDLYIDPDNYPWDSTSSFLKGGWSGGQNTKMVKVNATTLSSIISNSTVDLLKLDIEGTEQEVLEELSSSNSLKFIRNMLIEFHQTENQSFKKVENLLRSNKFDIETQILDKGLILIKAKAN